MFNIFCSISFIFLLTLTTLIPTAHSGCCHSRIKVEPSYGPEVGSANHSRATRQVSLQSGTTTEVTLVAQQADFDEDTESDNSTFYTSTSDTSASDTSDSDTYDTSISEGSISLEAIASSSSDDSLLGVLFPREPYNRPLPLNKLLLRHTLKNTGKAFRGGKRFAFRPPHHSSSRDEIEGLRAPPSTVSLDGLSEDLCVMYHMLQGLPPQVSSMALNILRLHVVPEQRIAFALYFSKYTHKYGMKRTRSTHKFIAYVARKMKTTKFLLDFLECLDGHLNSSILLSPQDDELSLLSQVVTMIPHGSDMVFLRRCMNRLCRTARESPLSVTVFLSFLRAFISDTSRHSILFQDFMS